MASPKRSKTSQHFNPDLTRFVNDDSPHDFGIDPREALRAAQKEIDSEQQERRFARREELYQDTPGKTRALQERMTSKFAFPNLATPFKNFDSYIGDEHLDANVDQNREEREIRSLDSAEGFLALMRDIQEGQSVNQLQESLRHTDPSNPESYYHHETKSERKQRKVRRYFDLDSSLPFDDTVPELINRSDTLIDRDLEDEKRLPLFHSTTVDDFVSYHTINATPESEDPDSMEPKDLFAPTQLRYTLPFNDVFGGDEYNIHKPYKKAHILSAYDPWDDYAARRMPAPYRPEIHRSWRTVANRRIINAHDDVNDRDLSWPMERWEWPGWFEEYLVDKPITWSWPSNTAATIYFFADKFIIGPLLEPLTDFFRHMMFLSTSHIRINYAYNFPFWYLIKLGIIGLAGSMAANAMGVLAMRVDRLVHPFDWSEGINKMIFYGQPAYTAPGQSPNFHIDYAKDVAREFVKRPYHIAPVSQGQLFLPFVSEVFKNSRRNTLLFITSWYKILPFLVMFPLMSTARTTEHPLVAASTWGLATAVAPTYAMRWMTHSWRQALPVGLLTWTAATTLNLYRRLDEYRLNNLRIDYSETSLTPREVANLKNDQRLIGDYKRLRSHDRRILWQEEEKVKRKAWYDTRVDELTRWMWADYKNPDSPEEQEIRMAQEWKKHSLFSNISRREE